MKHLKFPLLLLACTVLVTAGALLALQVPSLTAQYGRSHLSPGAAFELGVRVLGVAVLWWSATLLVVRRGT